MWASIFIRIYLTRLYEINYITNLISRLTLDRVLNLFYVILPVCPVKHLHHSNYASISICGKLLKLRVRICTSHGAVSKLPALFQRRVQRLTCSVYYLRIPPKLHIRFAALPIRIPRFDYGHLFRHRNF